jgi:hypothetical protein
MLTQSLVQSGLQPPAVSALSVWVGTIGGSALATDPNPNTTPPSAGRIVQCGTTKPGVYQLGAGFIRILAAPVAAATCSFVPWLFDDTIAAWFQYLQQVNLSPNGAASNISGLTIGQRLNQKAFVQLSVTNGVVQAFGYDFW